MLNDNHSIRFFGKALKLVNFFIYGFKLGDGLFGKLKLTYVFLRWKILLLVSERLDSVLPLPKTLNIVYNGVPLLIFNPPDISYPQVLYEVFVREDYLVRFPKPPTCILDAGANCGMASIFFSALYPNAVIHAFEPSSETFRFLKLNTAAFPNVKTHQLGLFSKTGTTKLFLKDSAGENSMVKDEGRWEEVKIMTLDEFAASNGITHADLMKIDVEGAEEEILRPSRFIQNIDFIVGELHLQLISKENILKTLEPYFDVKCLSHEPDLDVFTAENKKLR